MSYKRKGGAEKERIRKKALMDIDAGQCRKLTDMFAAPIAEAVISDDSSDLMSVLSPNEEHSLRNETTGNEDAEKSYPNFSQSESELGSTLMASTSSPTENDEDLNSYFSKPPVHCLQSFFKFHPKQQNFDSEVKLNYQNIYFRSNKPRHWLSYDENEKKLFCSFCLAFSKDTDQSTFISGYNVNNAKHIYQRISEHESSALHSACSEAYVLKINAKDIVSIILYAQTFRRG